MNIEGLDYNTQRKQLILPEYGREIQYMVDHAVTIVDKAERQRCAETIVGIMMTMIPQTQDAENCEQKCWDHLAVMSDFKLDVDYPYDISEARNMQHKPEPVPYPSGRIPVRHYGRMLFSIFEKLKSMEPGEERDRLTAMVANQMKRNLAQWNNSGSEDERVADDLARFTDGQIQLDINAFQFDKTDIKEPEKRKKKK